MSDKLDARKEREKAHESTTFEAFTCRSIVWCLHDLSDLRLVAFPALKAL